MDAHGWCTCTALWLLSAMLSGEGAPAGPPLPGGAAVDGLQLTLLPLKTTYEPDETIQFLLLVTNVTSRGQERPICLDARMVYNAHVRLEVADADGQDVRRPPGVVVFAEPAPPLQRDFVYLQPDRFLGREVLASRDPALTTALQPSGVYDVSATFESWEEGGQWELHAWTGSMTSNHVRVTITKGEARP